MIEEKLKELELLCEKAEGGLWICGSSDIAHARVNVVRRDFEKGSFTVAGNCRQSDAKFIAASRQALPELIAEVRRLREAMEKIKDAKCDPNVKPGPEDMTKNELMFCELSGRIHCIAKEALEEMEVK